jgi:hypothetical protein
MRRREFIAGLGSAAAWPVVARAQQQALPVIGFFDSGSADTSTDRVLGFRKGLGEIGYIEGQNVTVEYHWLESQFDRVPALTTGPPSCGPDRRARPHDCDRGQSCDRDGADRLWCR